VRCIITNSSFTGCTLNGVYAGGKTVISNCYFANNAKVSGGQIATGDNSLYLCVQNCVIDPGSSSVSCGIEASHQTTGGGEYILIGNRITGQGAHGIVSNGGTLAPAAILIEDNTVKNSGRNGISINGSHSNFVIEGNLCFDDQDTPTQANGIWIDAECNHYKIINNVCYSNTSAQIEDNGTGADKLVKGNKLKKTITKQKV
jgi:Right handed beta helix region